MPSRCSLLIIFPSPALWPLLSCSIFLIWTMTIGCFYDCEVSLSSHPPPLLSMCSFKSRLTVSFSYCHTSIP
jgi:hypothetical protein